MEAYRENKLGTMPIPRLLTAMGLPMMLSMMLQAVYNIVDSVFVANLPTEGEAALNALTLAFPVQMLVVAIGIGTGVGANAMISRSLGAGDRERASRTAGNTLLLATGIYLVFLLFGLFGTRVYVTSQTTNPQIAGMAESYLRICCVYSFGMVYFSMFEKILQAAGRSLYSTIAQVSGAVTNVILDPILIYGLLGAPALGVRGAAYATVIGQIVSCLAGLAAHLRFDREIDSGLRYWKPSGRLIGSIYAVGVPAILAQALMSIMTYLLNILFVQVGEAVVTAYGLYYKIQQFVLFAAFGLRDAITPIVAFNYGMGDRRRVCEGIQYGLRNTLLVMLLGFLALELLANPLAALFGLSGETEKLCISAMRVIACSYVFAGANIAYQGIFQALDSGIQSLLVSVCRQFLLVIPTAWGFSCLVRSGAAPVWLIWCTFLLAEGVSAALSVWLMRGVRKRMIDPMQAE